MPRAAVRAGGGRLLASARMGGIEVDQDGRDMALQALFPLYQSPQRTEDERDAYRAALRAALAEYGSDTAFYLLKDLG
nr:hypothetical protein GCM10020063_076780 [Dactylosporangium thailandense]